MTYSDAFNSVMKAFQSTQLADDGFVTIPLDKADSKYAKMIIRELRDTLVISHGVFNIEKNALQLEPNYIYLKRFSLW